MQNSEKALLSTQPMPRPRINQIFGQATRSKLVYVVAGAGCGKTRAVHQYIEQQQDAVVRWVQLTAGDNAGAHYWENLTRAVALDNPGMAQKLRALGFPDTPAQFKQFAAIQKTYEHPTKKTFLVLDDFHLIHSGQALAFAQRCANLQIPGACVIIISRKEPEMDVVALAAKGLVNIVTEDELRFTQSEIADFLRWQDTPFSARSLPQLFEATNGWALAVQLLGLVLRRAPDNLALALDTMKQNIFSLLEAEAFNDLPEDTRKSLVRLSLISDLPCMLWDEIADGASLLRGTPQLSSFMWFDSFIGGWRTHPLYLEFLQSRQDILSEDEKNDTYRKAAQWCTENQFFMDAMRYYARLGQFERMTETLLVYPFRLPRDTCEYLLELIEGLAPDEAGRANPHYQALHNIFVPLLLAGAEKYEQAQARCFETIRAWENADDPAAPVVLCAAYSNLTYIDMYTCIADHAYNAPAYLKKAVEYYNAAPVRPEKTSGAFAVADIRSFACLVGEGARPADFERFTQAVRQMAGYISEASNDMYYGYDALAACETALFENKPEKAASRARQAIVMAREKNQYSLESMALGYLLIIAMYKGDYPLVREVLRQLRAAPDTPDFWNRQLLYDLYTGFFYAQTGLSELIAPWLLMDEKEASTEVRIPARELIVCATGYIAAKKYDHALTVLSHSYPRKPHDRFLFGELILSLLTAAAMIRTGDTPGALREFEKAYALSFEGRFEMPFVELGRDLHPLAVAAAAQPDCKIPAAWLTRTDRKAAAYAKRISVLAEKCRAEQKIEEPVALSARESEVLGDLYRGLSREEIAASRYLSINTVKTIIQSLYTKLGANNNVDAVRLAIEKKLVE